MMNDDLDWRQRADCRNYDPEWWFPTAAAHTYAYAAEARRALRICDRCPVVDPCLQDALQVGPQHGIAGGKTAEERSALRSGRPPKAVVVWPLDDGEPVRPQCGSEAGAAAHRRRGEPLCDHCRREATWARARRAEAAS
jgi:hypothetical protein